MAPVLIRSPSAVQPGRCSLIEPYIALTESYGVLIGRTLVDVSEWSDSVLLVNPGSDVVVLPSFSSVGEFSAGLGGVCNSLGNGLSGGWSDPPVAPGRHCCILPLEGRTTLRNILHQYACD